ncbi:hypothetical protein GIB67_005004 [Kingdonia uniflora]|uniref:Clp1 P-loop domain-containing protein n=1 Tax=Kingdonia uniflora TaxID=39325 RepID=A0A7J7NNC5_9MAGN|nr:hypothetical protein GIB67_005004 [Kingdonia uniflora]
MPIDPVEGILLDMALIYYFGHATPSLNTELYKLLVKELAQTIKRRFVEMLNLEQRACKRGFSDDVVGYSAINALKPISMGYCGGTLNLIPSAIVFFSVLHILNIWMDIMPNTHYEKRMGFAWDRLVGQMMAELHMKFFGQHDQNWDMPDLVEASPEEFFNVDP